MRQVFSARRICCPRLVNEKKEEEWKLVFRSLGKTTNESQKEIYNDASCQQSSDWIVAVIQVWILIKIHEQKSEFPTGDPFSPEHVKLIFHSTLWEKKI